MRQWDNKAVLAGEWLRENPDNGDGRVRAWGAYTRTDTDFFEKEKSELLANFRFSGIEDDLRALIDKEGLI